MPFTVVVLVVAIAAAVARGGRLHRVAEADLRWNWLLFPGLGLQVAVEVFGASGTHGWASTATVLTSQALVVGWITANRYRPGMPLIFLGLVANAVVIAANGAMPVDPDAMAAAGLGGGRSLAGKHQLLTDTARLRWLADIVPVAALRTVISVGDIALAAGLIPLVHDLMTYRSPVERRGGPRPSAVGDGGAAGPAVRNR